MNKRGPLPDLGNILLVKKYREQGTPFRKIAAKINKPLRSVLRWSQYDVDELSTVIDLRVDRKGVE